MNVRRNAELKPVLMLVPYFAPQSHAAMFRAHKLARYLPEYGFKPIVVTADTNYLYNNDKSLLDELPPEVEIHRARYVEPTLRGVRMALGGTDRTFAAQKKASGQISIEFTGSSSNSDRATQRAGLSAMVNGIIGAYPDRHWTWSEPAYRLASKLIRDRNIRLMYTSANPVSFLRAAIRLHQAHGLRWLFDSRDPLGYGRKNSAKGWISQFQEQGILQKSMEIADHVMGLSRSYGQIFFDLYGLEERRFSFIPTGLDEGYLASDEVYPREDFLLYVGEVMPDQGRYAFTIFERLLEDSQGEDAFGKLLFVGRREINEPLVRRLTNGLPRVQSRIEFLDHRPQVEVYNLIQRARACLLVPGALRYWWTNFAKMVDYIALGVPVIAHVPLISEARVELSRAGTGFFMDGEEENDLVRLRSWLATSSQIVPTEYRNRYLVRQQVADTAAILHRLNIEN